MENYRKDSLEGGLDKYTKKERGGAGQKNGKIDKILFRIDRFEKSSGRFVYYRRKKRTHCGNGSQKRSGIPVVALVNSDSNIKGIDYPIVANDSGIPSIKFFTSAILNAYKEGQTSAPIKK